MRLLHSFIVCAVVVPTAVAANTPAENKEAERLEKAGASVIVDDKMPSSARLVVTFSTVDDKAVAGLKGLKHVGKLTVEDASKMTDKSMAVIGTWTELRELSLTKPGITNTGMTHVKLLKELRKLYLIDAKVNDSGVASLKTLDLLEELDVSGSAITNSAGNTFKDLPALKLLAVNKTKFGDTGSAYLKELKDLKKLEAVNTDLSEKGAKALEASIKGVRIRR